MFPWFLYCLGLMAGVPFVCNHGYHDREGCVLAMRGIDDEYEPMCYKGEIRIIYSLNDWGVPVEIPAVEYPAWHSG